MTSLRDSPTGMLNYFSQTVVNVTNDASIAEASPSAHEESETSLPIKTVEPEVTTEENEISLDYTDMDAVD